MKKNTFFLFLVMVSIVYFTFSCTTNDVEDSNNVVYNHDFKISDEAFGEYLYFREAMGVSRTQGGNGLSGYEYYIDTLQSKNQTRELDLNKSSTAIEKIKDYVKTAEIKIKNLDGIKYFSNIIGLILTSNEIEIIDLNRLTKLENLNLNNNLIGSLDLTNNINLVTFTYTASSKASNTQKLWTIDLSNNTKLTSVNLKSHPGAPFPIPLEIFNRLTTAEGVIPLEFKIPDEAFGEYLKYLNIQGVTEVKTGDIYEYFINRELAESNTGELNLSKSAASITILKNGGVRTAEVKIKNVDGLQFLTNITGLILTSNEVEQISLETLTSLKSLNLNNNFIGSIDLSKNTNLEILSYTASSKAGTNQKLQTINLSNNTKLTAITLTGHPGAPFPIPAAIYNQLTVKDGVIPEEDINKYKISDEAFGEYLKYLNVVGVTEVKTGDVYEYFIDKELAKNNTGELNMSKSAPSITILKNAGVRTAEVKIKNIDGLQFLINVTGLVLTSNEVEQINLETLTKLESLNLNNNFIGSLTLNKNTELKTLSYTASSKATASQKLSQINLSYNTKLTSVDLSNHPGAPFPIPAAIFNNLTVAKGVVSE